MKITIVPESFPQVSSTFIINEIWGLRKKGHDLAVVPRIAGSDSGWFHARCAEIREKIDFRLPGIAIDSMALPSALARAGQLYRGLRPRAIWEKLRDVLKIADLVRRIKATAPDVLVAHFGYDNAVACAIASRQTKTPMVLWMHGSDFHTVPHRHLRWITDACSTVVTHSQYAERCLIALRVQATIVRSIMGVDLAKFKPDVDKKESVPTVVCVARLGHAKNHERLLRVFSYTKRLCGDARLWLIGGGPKENALKELSDALALSDSVSFLGEIPSEKIPSFLCRAWVKALFSDREGLGVAFMEALACGTPCVASNVGGIPEVVQDGVTGLLFDFSAENAEEKAGKRLAELLRDNQRRAKMSAAAVNDAATRFDENRHFDFMDKLLRSILDENKS